MPQQIEIITQIEFYNTQIKKTRIGRPLISIPMAIGEDFVPQFLPLPLAQAKNDDEQFWKLKFHATNEKGKRCTHERSNYFFLFEEGGKDCFRLFLMCSHDVPMMFLPAYQKVPHVVPQHVHNSMSDVSHMVCPKFNSHVYELKKGRTQGEHICFYFATGASIGGSAQMFQNIDDGPINMVPSKNKPKIKARRRRSENTTMN